MDITSVLYALLSLAVAILIIYGIIWVLTYLGITIPENIKRVIWVILVLLAAIWIVNHFFIGGNEGLHIRR